MLGNYFTVIGLIELRHGKQTITLTQTLHTPVLWEPAADRRMLKSCFHILRYL
jgi:hypothetical protein